MFDSQDNQWMDGPRMACSQEEREMRTVLKVIIMFAISLLLMGIARAEGFDKSRGLKKVKADLVGAVTVVKGLETYYGDSFSTEAIKNFKKGKPLGSILSQAEIQLNNGQVYSTSEIEFAFVPRRARNIVTNRYVRPMAKAPHEKAPHEKAPHEKAPHEQN